MERARLVGTRCYPCGWRFSIIPNRAEHEAVAVQREVISRQEAWHVCGADHCHFCSDFMWPFVSGKGGGGEERGGVGLTESTVGAGIAAGCRSHGYIAVGIAVGCVLADCTLWCRGVLPTLWYIYSPFRMRVQGSAPV